MAAKPPKRLLEDGDFKSPDRIQEVLNPILELLPAAFDKGLTLGNLKHVQLSVQLDVEDDWKPVTMGTGWAGTGNPLFPTPSYCYLSEVEVLLRGEVERTSGTGADILTGLPAAAYRKHCIVDTGTGVARADVTTAGTLSGDISFVALDAVRYITSAPRPNWARPVEAAITGTSGQDWGQPWLVLALSVERKDRAPSRPEPFPAWETAFVGEGRSKKRVMRLLRVGGLKPGRQVLQLVCLYP